MSFSTQNERQNMNADRLMWTCEDHQTFSSVYVDHSIAHPNLSDRSSEAKIPNTVHHTVTGACCTNVKHRCLFTTIMKRDGNTLFAGTAWDSTGTA